MKILVDLNIQGEAALLFATIQETGWIEILELEFVYFSQTPLAENDDDATVWRYAQAQNFLLLTDNRNRHGQNSMQATLERENHSQALPVLTVGNKKRLNETEYRLKVALAIADVAFYLDNYRGTGRVFIP
jgi:Neuraminidase (sialidase)